MKPKLNKTVYTIYRTSITKSKVAYLGNDSFITDHFNSYDYGYEFYYDKYEETWFTSFDKAKKKILDGEKNVELKQFADDYWEVVDK